MLLCLNRYESAFISVGGDLKATIQPDNIPQFIEALFPYYPYRGNSLLVSRCTCPVSVLIETLFPVLPIEM